MQPILRPDPDHEGLVALNFFIFKLFLHGEIKQVESKTPAFKEFLSTFHIPFNSPPTTNDVHCYWCLGKLGWLSSESVSRPTVCKECLKKYGSEKTLVPHGILSLAERIPSFRSAMHTNYLIQSCKYTKRTGTWHLLVNR